MDTHLTFIYYLFITHNLKLITYYLKPKTRK